MNSQELAQTLEQFGLLPKEAKVYLAALTLGPTTVLQIAKGSGLRRTTVYSIIDSLQRSGLINIEIKGFKQLFVAENPQTLRKILVDRTARLEGILPELTSLYKFKGDRGVIKYYSGLEAVKNVYKSLLEELKPKDFYYIISDQDRWYFLDRAYYQAFIERRARLAEKLDLNIKLLLTESELARQHQSRETIYQEKIKILPKKTVLTTNLVVTPGKVVIHQLVAPIFAITIENQSIIQMFRELFEIIWQY